jgi:hypothetical protein
MGTSRARYLIVQVVDTLAIDVGEPRVITRVPGQRFALTITDHEPEISKFKKGPAADPVVLVESKLLDKKMRPRWRSAWLVRDHRPARHGRRGRRVPCKELEARARRAIKTLGSLAGDRS